MSSLTELREKVLSRISSATGPDRQLDAVIAAAINAPHGQHGYADDEDEIAASYSASLDAAVTIVPPGWRYQVGVTSLFAGWANVYEMHPDHCDPGINEFGATSDKCSKPREGRGFAPTPALCLCWAAVAARLSKAGQRSLRALESQEQAGG